MTLWQTQFEQNLKTLALTRATGEQPPLSALEAQAFKDYLHKIARTLPGLLAVYPNSLPDGLLQACDTLYNFPTLTEHVALMAKILPTIYSDSVFSAVGAYAIAQTLQYSQAQCEVAFCAGLLHDIGFLYYPANPNYNHLDASSIIDNSIRAHGPVAAGIIRRIKGAPTGLADIIRDHHELIDGTGYPNHKTEADLNPLVFVIGVTDLLARATREYAVYPLHYQQLSRLVLQLNAAQIPHLVYQAAIDLTRHKPDCLEPATLCPNAAELCQQRSLICKSKAQLTSTLLLLQKHQAIDYSQAAAGIAQHLQATCRRIGIEQPEYESWLNAQASSLELLNYQVIQNEICHQLARLYAAISEASKRLCDLEITLKTQVKDLQSQVCLPSLIIPAHR